MRKISIPKDPVQAAVEFKSSMERLNFSIIPKTIGSDARFWLKLVELDNALIKCVPNEILNNPEFSMEIDHIKFFSYIPKKFLTVKEYEFNKNNPESEIIISGFYYRAEINNHEDSIWVTLSHLEREWYPIHQVTPEMILNSVDELNPADKIISELWSQDLADLIWNSRLAMISFDSIPKQFVRAEWAEIMDLNAKRCNFCNGDKIAPEKLATYWKQFSSVESMKTAIQLEKKLIACSNPYGYGEFFGLSGKKSSSVVDIRRVFEDLWQGIRHIIENDTELINDFVKLYENFFAVVLPDELFDDEWVVNDYSITMLVEDYVDATRDAKEAESEVERYEAQKLADESKELALDLIREYRTSDEAVNLLFERLLAEAE